MARQFEVGLKVKNKLRKVDDSICDDPIFNTETYEEMNIRVKEEDDTMNGSSTVEEVLEWEGVNDVGDIEYDDGVCEGEYVHPTQVRFAKEELLEKLKDFNYWKEWKHK